MKRLQRSALLAELAERLTKNESWCGETNVQKTTYFLQELLGVPTAYNFIFYKFGPFSFDLRDELAAMEADELITLRVRHPGYGPSIVPTEQSKALRELYPVTLKKYETKLDFVSRTFGSKGVTELERLSTALYVTRELGEQADVSQRAKRICELKPHVSLSDAFEAVREFDTIEQKAREL